MQRHMVYAMENFKPKHKDTCMSANTNNLTILGKVLCQNGVYQYKMKCWECGNKGHSVPHFACIGIDDSHIPLIDNYIGESPCERCGKTDGLELHHWAPKHLFEDADYWPRSWLCRRCHAEWHDRVTPNMSHV